MDMLHTIFIKIKNKIIVHNTRKSGAVINDTSLMKERFLALADMEELPVSCWLPDTTLTFVNSAYCTLTAKNKESLLGQKWIELMPDTLKDKTQKIYQAFVHKPDVYRFEYCIHRKGEMRCIEWVNHPVYDMQNNVIEFLSVGRDITEQKMKLQCAQQEVREALKKVQVTKREWEITVDALPQIICLIDIHGNIVRTNKPIEDWGMSNLTDARGKSIHAILHPHCSDGTCELSKSIADMWQKARCGESSELISTIPWLHKTVCVKMHPHTKRKDHDDEYAAVVVVYDISEKRKANEKIFEMFKYLGVLNRKISVVLGVNKGGEGQDAHHAFDYIVQSSMKIAQAQFSFLYFLDRKKQQFTLLGCGGMLSHEDRERMPSINVGQYVFTRKIYDTNERVQGTRSDATFRSYIVDNKFEKMINMCLAIPLIHQDELRGILILGFEKDHEPITQELEIYDLFAMQSCQVLLNAMKI